MKPNSIRDALSTTLESLEWGVDGLDNMPYDSWRVLRFSTGHPFSFNTIRTTEAAASKAKPDTEQSG